MLYSKLVISNIDIEQLPHCKLCLALSHLCLQPTLSAFSSR